MFAEICCKDIAQLRTVLHDELQKIKALKEQKPLFHSTKVFQGMSR
jgi:hypothetical protein